MPRKIIIIEDDEDTLDIMSYILTEEGYEIISANSSKLLNEVHILQPVLILMDNRLPEGLGCDICKHFKSNPATTHYPVILVSANMGLEMIALESHADGYLKKPFDISELLEIVRRFD